MSQMKRRAFQTINEFIRFLVFFFVFITVTYLHFRKLSTTLHVSFHILIKCSPPLLHPAPRIPALGEESLEALAEVKPFTASFIALSSPSLISWPFPTSLTPVAMTCSEKGPVFFFFFLP